MPNSFSDAPTDARAVLSIEEVVGFWRVAPATGAGDCLIALNRLAVGGAYGVHIEKCSLSALAAARDWLPVPGGFELRDAAGASIIRFRQTGVDAFVAVQGGYRMERAPVS